MFPCNAFYDVMIIFIMVFLMEWLLEPPPVMFSTKYENILEHTFV